MQSVSTTLLNWNMAFPSDVPVIGFPCRTQFNASFVSTNITLSLIKYCFVFANILFYIHCYYIAGEFFS